MYTVSSACTPPAAAASAEERAAAFGFRAGHRRYERRTQHGIEQHVIEYGKRSFSAAPARRFDGDGFKLAFPFFRNAEDLRVRQNVVIKLRVFLKHEFDFFFFRIQNEIFEAEDFSERFYIFFRAGNALRRKIRAHRCPDGDKQLFPYRKNVPCEQRRIPHAEQRKHRGDADIRPPSDARLFLVAPLFHTKISVFARGNRERRN